MAVRTTRARIIRLRNDYKGLMSKIEDGLYSHHAQARAIPTVSSQSESGQVTGAGNSQVGASAIKAPFAKVNSVVSDSPAEQAGLKTGDTILKFGNVDWINHEKLSKIAETVQRNEGVSWPRA